MVFCPGENEQLVGSLRPNAGNVFEDMRPDQNPVFANRDWHESQSRERTNHADWTEVVSGSIGGDTTPGAPTNAKDVSALSAGARGLTNLIDRAVGAENLRLNEYNDAVQRLSGATVSDASRWLNVTNAISKFAAWKSAQFNKWALTNFGTVGRNILDNPIVNAFNAAEPAIQGQLQLYTNRMRDITRVVDPIAGRLGRDTQELMIAVGDFMNGQHAPERNALLLARWGGELAAERAKPANKRDQRAITNLEAKIDNLQRNLDNLVTVDPEGNQIHIESSGYTNAEARKLMQDVLDTGMTREEIESIASQLRDLNHQILQDRIDRGLVPPEVVESFPDFEFYVPFRTKFDNTTGVINNSNVFNPGKYYEIDGTSTKPDSAYLSIMHHAQRAANEIGMQPLGTELAAAVRTAAQQGRKIGLEMHDYGKVSNALFGNLKGGAEYRRNMQRWAENLNNQGGIVTDVPMFDAEGNAAGMKRMLLTFDQSWTDPHSKLTGAELNAALSGTVKSWTGMSSLARLTSTYGQFFTRWNPAFAPINGLMRDPIERAMHMVGRDYYDTAGNVVRGSSLVGNYFLNMPRSGKILYDAMRGNLDPNSPLAQFWREYIENGVRQQYTRGMNETRRTLADVIKEAETHKPSWTENNLNKMPGLRDQMKALGRNAEAVKNTFDGWNDYFNNINIFNQFVTMREAGISPRNAAKGTLELLDLSKSGTVQPFLATMFPFVRPTVQTAVATARTLGLAPDAAGKFRPNIRGAMGVVGTTAAITTLLPLLKEGLGIDEDSGMYRFDQIPLSRLAGFIPIGIGDGDYVKLHTGFGLPQVAMTLAVGLDRVQRGLMAPEDLAFETLYTMGKNVMPGDFPEFSAKAKPMEWLRYALAPSVLKPVVATTDFMGRPITTATADGTRPMAEQGRMGTERVYHQMARMLYNYTGIDMAPEQVRNWTRHLSAGPLKLFTGILEGGELPLAGAILDDNGLRTGGTQKTAMQEMGPFFSAMGGSLIYGRTTDNGRAMYYQALNEYRRRIRSEGIDITSREYGSDIAKREAFQRRALERAGWSSAEIADYLLLTKAEHELGSNNTKFAQEIRPIFISSEDSTPIRAQFESLATRNAAIYNSVLPQLNYYAGAR